VIEATSDVAGKMCSICQTSIIAGEHILSCGYCTLPFHAECWDENRGCSAYGCEGAPKTVKTQVDTAPVSNAWGEEKPCPSCGRTIKGQALKCRFCGASFSTRDVIDKKEYECREYEDKEYVAARNKVVALFILSAAGCLSPIGLIIALVLIKTGSSMGIEFKRLPDALKAVVYSSVGISCLLLLIMAMLIILD
jgi:hypothetical protein